MRNVTPYFAMSICFSNSDHVSTKLSQKPTNDLFDHKRTGAQSLFSGLPSEPVARGPISIDRDNPTPKGVAQTALAGTFSGENIKLLTWASAGSSRTWEVESAGACPGCTIRIRAWMKASKFDTFAPRRGLRSTGFALAWKYKCSDEGCISTVCEAMHRGRWES
jgi:hypothetical protein